MNDDEFGILLVCTANACRSPLMQYLLQDALERALGASAAAITVTSAGLRCYGGMPMHPLSLDQLAARGLDGAAFASTPLTADAVRAADVVITADRAHRDAVVSLVPSANRRVFTLRELGMLLANLPPLPATDDATLAGKLRALVESAADHRGLHRPAVDTDYDISDPIGRSPKVFAACAGDIAAAVDLIAAAFVSGVPA